MKIYQCPGVVPGGGWSQLELTDALFSLLASEEQINPYNKKRLTLFLIAPVTGS
jgi:hypothetical protein